MKKLLCLLIAVICILSVVSCGDTASSDNGTAKTDNAKETKVLPTVLDTSEYTLYTNIFYNGYADNFTNKTVTKKGTFTTLYDEYNGVTRYYCWGYNDNTKCCDWQWEFVPTDISSLPTNGCLISVTGTFVADTNALDGYWIKDAEVTVTTKYIPDKSYDVDLCTMGGTLERVEIINIQNIPDFFNGKTVSAYGRVYSDSSIQHPYYDGDFEFEFSTSDSVPSIGTYVIVTGTLKDGSIVDATVEETDLY